MPFHPTKIQQTVDVARAVVRIENGAQEVFTPQHIATLLEWVDQYGAETPRESLVSTLRSALFSHEHLRTDKVIELQQL